MPTKSRGAEIRRLREEKGLSCSQLADALGLDRAFIWKIENGLLDGAAGTRLKIAQFFGVPLTDITYFEARHPRSKQAA